MKTQLRKGVVEIFVLAHLKNNESYGYEIVSNLSPYTELSESTLYPILRRLEQASELETYNVLHQGRNRKYYRITNLGLKHIELFLREWNDIIETYYKISQSKEKV